MTTISEKALRQLGDAGSRLAVSVARDEHVLRRVDGSSREGEWTCSCGVGFPVSGDARDRANIEHSAHLYATVVEATRAAGYTLSTEWMVKAIVAEREQMIVSADRNGDAGGLSQAPADSRPTAHLTRGQRIAMAINDASVRRDASIDVMTDRQISNVLHGRDQDDNGEFTASSMGAVQEALASKDFGEGVTALVVDGGPGGPSRTFLDVGPDFRVVPVRVLRDALAVLDYAVDYFTHPKRSSPPPLRVANSARIEIGHLINERRS